MYKKQEKLKKSYIKFFNKIFGHLLIEEEAEEDCNEIFNKVGLSPRHNGQYHFFFGFIFMLTHEK